MFGMGITELLVVLIIVLIVFGASRLPEIGTSLGKAIRGFKESVSGKDAIDVTPKRSGETKEDKSDGAKS